MISGRTISASHFGAPPQHIADLSFHKCFFDNCSLAQPPDPERRSVIRNVSLVQCKQRASLLAGAVLDNVLVDGLGREGRIPLFLAGVVFRHVTLKGRLTFFKVQASPSVNHSSEQVALWQAANRAFYAHTDWALDISEARFTSGPDLHFIPGALVRIDPASQALVSRRALSGISLPGLPWAGSALRVALEWFLADSPYEDVVLVAAKGTTYFQRDLAAINMLREKGIAEPH